MWILCECNVGASNSHLQLIAAYLPSRGDLPFFEGLTLVCCCHSLLWLDGCLAEQDHLQPPSRRAMAGAVPAVRTQQEAGVAQPTCWEKPWSLISPGTTIPVARMGRHFQAASNRASKGCHSPIFLCATGIYCLACSVHGRQTLQGDTRPY